MIRRKTKPQGGDAPCPEKDQPPALSSGEETVPTSTAPAVTFTPKEALFCQEYTIDLNATQAAIRAGYSQKTARSIGYENLTKPHIKNRIAELQQARAKQLGITAEKVLAELAKLGFSNMGDYMQVGPDGLPHLKFGDLTRDQTAALTEVTVEEYWDEGAPVPMDENYDEEEEGKPQKQQYGRPVKKVKFKLSDKRAALVDIGRHIGMFAKQDEGEEAAAATLYRELLAGFLHVARVKPVDAIEV